jgi:hypothetical protein
MEAPLHRQTSIKSHTTTRTQIIRQDGHVEGHLNCIASRHGWTRTFAVTPEQVSTLDYITLEVLLELPTLKLRSSQLRVFVENPPNSGTFSKIRFWKDDGSLQSVLVKQFFEKRMTENIVTILDIRDGNEREDTTSILSGMGGLGGGRMVLKPGQAKEWLRRSRGANRSNATVNTVGLEDEEEAPSPKPAQKTSRMQAFMYAIGVSNKPPAAPPKPAEDGLQEMVNEEETLKKRGWMPPVIRQITSRRPQIHVVKTKQSLAGSVTSGSNPFASRSQRNLIRVRTKSRPGEQDDSGIDVHNALEEDAEEINAEELALMANEDTQRAGGSPHKPSKWLKFLGNNESSERQDNPFLGPKEKDVKGKGKAAFRGAQVVKKPSDAFERGPSTGSVDDEIDP